MGGALGWSGRGGCGRTPLWSLETFSTCCWLWSPGAPPGRRGQSFQGARGVRPARVGQEWEKEPGGTRSPELLEWDRGASLGGGPGPGWEEDWGRAGRRAGAAGCSLMSVAHALIAVPSAVCLSAVTLSFLTTPPLAAVACPDYNSAAQGEEETGLCTSHC